MVSVTNYRPCIYIYLGGVFCLSVVIVIETLKVSIEERLHLALLSIRIHKLFRKTDFSFFRKLKFSCPIAVIARSSTDGSFA